MMSNSFPAWLLSLIPARPPELEPLSEYSAQLAWHVDIELRAWPVPPNTVLTGSETWNGKALVMGAASGLERSVGEVEVTQRLRSTFPGYRAYWTAGSGNPPRQWREWAFTPPQRATASWLLDFDRELRFGNDLLHNNQRGWPDVVMWKGGPADLFCVEYKGPRPSSPAMLDEISVEQDAWYQVAIEQGKLRVDRYAVVRWTPTPEDRAILLQQARASAAGKAERRESSVPVTRARTATAHSRKDAKISSAAVNRRNQEGRAATLLSEPSVHGKSIIIFPAGEAGVKGRFLSWREANPDGFVINLRAPRNAMFHRARCHTLGEPWDDPMHNAKVVADMLAELDRLAESGGWNRKDCGYCSRYLAT